MSYGSDCLAMSGTYLKSITPGSRQVEVNISPGYGCYDWQ